MDDAPSKGERPPSWRTRLTEIAFRRSDEAMRLYERTRDEVEAVDMADGIVRRYQAANGPVLAGYLAYRLFLLIVPLIVVIVAVAGFDRTGAQSASHGMGLGASLASTISTAGKDAHRSRLPLLIVGLFAFARAAWKLLGALQFGYAQAWQIRVRKFAGKARIFLRLSGSLFLFAVVVYLAAVVRRAGLLLGFAGSLATAASAFVGYVGLGWILPRRSKEWYWLLPGAAAGAIIEVGLQVMATYYIPDKLSHASKTYGALGLTITLFSYLYLIGLTLMLVPVVNSVVWARFKDDPPNLFRRIADRIPIPTESLGSGYVEEGEEVDTTSPVPFERGSPGPS
jgi:uncharacterized BrkB/YihY/UPF0761 family membrane protein